MRNVNLKFYKVEEKQPDDTDDCILCLKNDDVVTGSFCRGSMAWFAPDGENVYYINLPASNDVISWALMPTREEIV